MESFHFTEHLFFAKICCSNFCWNNFCRNTFCHFYNFDTALSVILQKHLQFSQVHLARFQI